MEVTTTAIPGLVHFVPTPHHDERGFFSRTFDVEVAATVGIGPDHFIQDSMSRSKKGVIRGLHVRVGDGEGKLVRCSAGAIFDVVVDLRPESPAHLTCLSFDLSGENQCSIYIPPGCAHGFQALTEPADTAYRISRSHDPSEDLTIAYDDPDLAVAWPQTVGAMSLNDREARPLSELGDRLALIKAYA